MNKILLFKTILSLSLFIVLVGCVQQKPTYQYIDKRTSDLSLIKPEETFSLRFFVINPSINTFVGSLNYTFDDKCLNSVNGNSNIIEIRPNDNLPVIKEFYYEGRGYRFNSDTFDIRDIPECYQKNLKISVFLYDKSGLLRDNQNFYLSIAK